MTTSPNARCSAPPLPRIFPRVSFLVLALAAVCGGSGLPAQVWVDITGPDGVCPGGGATLTASSSGDVSYAWSTGETTQSIDVFPAYPGETYSVTVTDSEGNSASDDHTVTVYDAPVVNISGPDHVCLGDFITLDAGAGYLFYAWSTGETTQTIDVSPGVDTYYSVTVTDANGCPGSCTDFLVSVWDYPSADIFGPFWTCPGEAITLTASPDGCTYLWSTGETTQSIDVSPWSSEYYSVTVTNDGGCESTYYDYLVTVFENNAVTGQPQPLTIQSGETAILSLTAVGDGLVYQWYQGLSGDMSVSVGGDSDTLVTDPLTDTSPFWCRVQGTCGGEVASDTAWVTVRQTPNAAVFDFDGDGFSDILWRNDTAGVLTSWLVGEGSVVTDLFLGETGGVDWQVAGVGDADGDGRSDILWRNLSTGALSMWLPGASGVTVSPFPGTVDLAWVTQGLGDVDRDGKADLFWRNDVADVVSLWFLDGGDVPGAAFIGDMGTVDWQVTGVADFNGDGTTDIFWRHTGTGAISIWFVNQTGSFGSDLSPGAVDPAWKVVGFGDLDRDNCDDILWRHASTGDLAAWLMHGGGLRWDVYLGSVSDLDWRVAGVGDFNSDGRTDLLWRHTPTGTLAYWFLSGLGVVGTASPGAVDPSWQTQNHTNLNGFPAGGGKP